MSFLENLFFLFRRKKPAAESKAANTKPYGYITEQVEAHRIATERARQYHAQARLSDRTAPPSPPPQEDFVTSAAVGYATDNAVLGYMVGGSLAGGVLGAAMHSHSDPATSCSSSSSDTGSSWSSGSSDFGSSSCDSGSSSFGD